ncbi:MAG TPA: class I SAM-dependent methyltransferase [Myxococcota bacterium]|nr:class I SAM-dependent methyltransferase [Myxococcota bacterium]
MTALPFAGAAAHYRFRPPYAPAALDFVCAELGLGAASRALDLGCGPGRLALALAPRVHEVVAVDVDPDMLAEGERSAREQGVRNVRWLCLPAEAISSALGSFRAAVLGQSFHWMDRDRVLERLAELLEEGGGLALVGPGTRRRDESWEALARLVTEKYLGPHARHALTNPEPENEPALRRSPHFAPPESRDFLGAAFERDAASILGCIYSHSTSTRLSFGARAEEFERELLAALARANPAGRFRERLETEVVIARKRTPGP